MSAWCSFCHDFAAASVATERDRLRAEVASLTTRVSELSAELVEARGALQHMQDYADATGMCAVCNHEANVCDKRMLCLGADQRLALRAELHGEFARSHE